MDSIGYRVGNDLYYNKHLAVMAGMRSGQSVQFYCQDDYLQKFDWTQEPAQSLRELMARRARELRDQHERLILLWSGGTDSHTIYNVFKENQIHLDEIIIKTSEHHTWHPRAHLVWLQENHWDPHTKITSYDQHDQQLKLLECQDDEWVFQNQGHFWSVGVSDTGAAIKFLIEKNHGGKRWMAITGLEKTRLIYRRGRWYARQLDLCFRRMMGLDYIEPFYLDPLITIKQSHLYKRAVKDKIKRENLPLYDNDWAESKYVDSVQGYREKAEACGLDPELTPGMSHLQKLYADMPWLVDVITPGAMIHSIRAVDPVLHRMLESGSTVAEHYVNGLLNLRSQTSYIQHILNDGTCRGKNQILNHDLIFSREYDLGE